MVTKLRSWLETLRRDAEAAGGWAYVDTPGWRAVNYAIAVASTGFTALIASALTLQRPTALLLFAPALLISAATGGLAPALLALGLSLASVFLLWGAAGLGQPDALLEVALFLIVAGSIAVGGEQWRRTRLTMPCAAKRRS